MFLIHKNILVWGTASLICMAMGEQCNNRFPKLHVGVLIKNELERQERTVSWFARKLSCDRSNVYKLFKRPNIDTELLLRVSVILDYNFFDIYQEEVDGIISHKSVDALASFKDKK